MYKIILCFFISVLFFGCGNDYTYEETLDFPDDGWAYDDVFEATFLITDTTAIYNLHLEIEHDINFSYQNFYTKIHTTFPSGERLAEKISLQLMGKVGLWEGDCNSETCVLNIPIQQGAFFSQAGEYKLGIEQFSRLNPLSGIRKLTFRLEDTKQKK